MRLIIDLQGAQSVGSRNRGIGRYTRDLVRAMARARGDDEIILLLSAAHGETIADLRAFFKEVLPPEAIRIWSPLAPTSANDEINAARRDASEIVREATINALRPDFVLVSSLFEGHGDNTVSSIKRFDGRTPVAVILYDLIPLIYREIYLANGSVDLWYADRLENLSRADLLLAISGSSRLEAIEHLGFDPSRVVNISGAVSEDFIRRLDSPVDMQTPLRHGLVRPYLMYTGGIDHRKNIEGLIAAYCALPRKMRQEHQLAIVCHADAPIRQRLLEFARSQGASEDEVVLTGFVPDQDLHDLYGGCKAFVFPSKHEGFGLPVLEAMMHGKAVIASNSSSLPEVVGRADALFDPRNQTAISAAINRLLGDPAYRASLESHAAAKAREFSWEQSARTAWSAIRQSFARRQTKSAHPHIANKLSLAFVSPLPPDRSGIADYSDFVSRRLVDKYNVTCVVEKTPERHSGLRAIAAPSFEARAAEFDRVIYQLGNSHFHRWMFSMIERWPGLATLHDFQLGGSVADGNDPDRWDGQIFNTAGFAGVVERNRSQDPTGILDKYPCNLHYLQSAVGVLAHSNAPFRAAARVYRDVGVLHWAQTPMPRAGLTFPDRAAARMALKIGTDDFIIVSFGIMGWAKLCDTVVAGWIVSRLRERRDAKLVFVGDGSGDFGPFLVAKAKESGVDNIKITGWVDDATYLNYLAAADVAIQLRRSSRCEVSAAFLDCLGAGLPTIANNAGSMEAIPDDVCIKISADPCETEVAEAFDRLSADSALRSERGVAAQRYFREVHASDSAIDRYVEAIEAAYADARLGVDGAIARIAPRLVEAYGVEALAPAAVMLARSIPQACEPARIFVEAHDVEVEGAAREDLLGLICFSAPSVRIEPFRFSDLGEFHLTRKAVLRALSCYEHSLDDELASPRGDDFVLVRRDLRLCSAHDLGALNNARLNGARLSVLVLNAAGRFQRESAEWIQFGAALAMFDLIFWMDPEIRNELGAFARPDALHVVIKADAESAARVATIVGSIRSQMTTD